jgi:hypothetical protein
MNGVLKRKSQKGYGLLKLKPVIAGILSMLVPGLGQVYAGESKKGGAIIGTAIVVGSLNIIILPLIAIANPVIPTSPPDSQTIWIYWIPRVVHDMLSLWSIIFWCWAIYDAVLVARNISAN